MGYANHLKIFSLRPLLTYDFGACLKIGKSHDGEEMLKERRSRQEPWNDLQLPDGHKRLVQSLIESHSPNKSPNSLHLDLVRAKGVFYSDIFGPRLTADTLQERVLLFSFMGYRVLAKLPLLVGCGF